MKYSAKAIFVPAGAAMLALLCSCTQKENIAGLWQGNPTRLEISGEANAMATTTLNFSPSTDGRSGHVNISSIIEVEEALPGSPENNFAEPYAVSVSATASADATYTYEDGDDDDIILSFFPSSYNINVDPDGVTFDRKILTGTMQPHVDSLSAVVAARMKDVITKAIYEDYSKYQKIEDIKIHHGDMMSCEINDRDHTFRKVE